MGEMEMVTWYEIVVFRKKTDRLWYSTKQNEIIRKIPVSKDNACQKLLELISNIGELEKVDVCIRKYTSSDINKTPAISDVFINVPLMKKLLA